MPNSSEARVTSVERLARLARRQIKGLSRPAGEFDARRYFRGTPDLGFYNVGTQTIRQLARAIVGDKGGGWTIDHAQAFAELLIADRYLDVKGLGVEVLARYRRAFTRPLLPLWKRWLAQNHAANWATTDAICGMLIGPLLLAEPTLVEGLRTWARSRNMWVRRASAVSLILPVRRGLALNSAYDVARTLHADRQDLIQKAVGWLLREAGKVDPARLDRYLRAYGPTIPRTTVRYAIERFSLGKRRELLAVTLVTKLPLFR